MSTIDINAAFPPALPAGQNRDRLRLWDKQYRLIWDEATAATPAYQHVSTWVNASIDRADGTRWVGQFFRCPEGVKRFAYEDRYLTMWPDFTSAYSHDTAWGDSQ